MAGYREASLLIPFRKVANSNCVVDTTALGLVGMTWAGCIAEMSLTHSLDPLKSSNSWGDDDDPSKAGSPL